MQDPATVLLPALARLPGHLLWRAHARALPLLAARLPVGVDLHVYGVLVALGEGEPRSQQSLAQTTKLSSTTVARVAADLAGQRLVERTRNPADRRSYLLSRTPAGAAAVASWAPYVREAEESLAADLSARERDELRGLLRDLVRDRAPHEAAHEPAPDGRAADQLDNLAFLVTRAHYRVHRDVQAGLTPLGLEPRHLGALTALSDTGPVSQAELARHLGVSDPIVVQIADGLEARGLVRRRRAIHDRREQVLHLTSSTSAVLAQAGTLAAEALGVRLGQLPEAQAGRLVALLRRLVEH